MFPVMSAGNPITGYNINNSLRFRSSASAYLSRTLSTPTNNKIWTLSFWVKRSTLTTTQVLFATASEELRYISDGGASGVVDSFQYNAGAGYGFRTNAIYRDVSAWYHIIVAVDTTQATAANRARIYINGVEASTDGTYNITQNTNTQINSAVAHNIGRRTSGSLYFDGYMTEINFVDGQQLTPSSFGSTDATTGQWLPKQYSSTYGSNGFYLKFADASAATAAAIGKDSSGNGNNWTPSGISVTTGATYDAMIDSPTLTSATVANYAVMNPLDWISASGTLSSANLNWASSASGCGNRATIGATSGKWYWEAVGSSVTSGTVGGRFAFTGSDTIAVEQDKFGMYWHPTSGIARIVNGTNTYVTSAYTYTNSDVLALALDLDNNISYWYKNGVLQYTYDFSAYSTIGARVFFPYVWNASSGTPSWVYNFGQRAFSYTPPTNYVALNTYNLPTPTIKAGNKYMDATLYTGTGAALNVTNAGGFKPDFVWVKDRGVAQQHLIYDSIRGVYNFIGSSSTAAESTNNQTLTSFNSNGFGLGTNGTSNSSAGSFVGWQWQAGQGSSSSNTNGSITSTVSASTTAGFSVVTYTGTGANATVGHGLGVAPKMIIVKERSAVNDWPVYHSGQNATPQNGLVYLNATNAYAAASTIWNNTAPTSTTFAIGTSGATNASTQTYVAYCWAEIAGFSKFGSYTGNYNVDGTFVYCGFRPKFILIKCTSTAYDWELIDTSRSTYNGSSNYLQPNLTSSEYSTTSDIMDILSNGFKMRNNWTRLNDSGAPFIFAAFAENPFKYSNAR